MLIRIILAFSCCFFSVFHLHAQDGLKQVAPDTSNIKWSGKVKQGKRVGEWKGKDVSNTLRVKMNYVNGVLNGEWNTFDYDGRLIEKGNYISGKREGRWIGLYDNGDTLYIAPYSDGRINGFYVEYYPYHHIKCSGNLSNNLREGKWEEYNYISGYKEVLGYKTSTYVHDTLHGPAQRFVKKVLTEEMNFKNGKLDGRCRWFDYPGGEILRDEMYVNNKQHGVSIRYWNNSRVVADSGNWEMGNRAGYHIHRFTTRSYTMEWFRTPLRDSVFIPNYKNTGEKIVRAARSIERRDSVKKYQGDGILVSKQVYRDTTAEVWILGGVYDNYVYSSDGRLLTKSTVVGNITRGYVTYYYPNGKVKAVIHEKSNDPFPASWYYEDGKLRAYEDSVIAYRLSNHVVLYDRKGKLIPESAENYLFMRDSLYILSSMLVRTVPAGSTEERLFPPTGERWETETLMFAEEMPSFPGGEEAFQNYLKYSIVYPTGADSLTEGTVYVYFEVAKDGSIGNVKALKSIPGHPAFSDEAIRVIAAMPAWNPGMMNGRAVKVGLTVPVKFVK